MVVKADARVFATSNKARGRFSGAGPYAELDSEKE
jgi:hypothetical protein